MVGERLAGGHVGRERRSWSGRGRRVDPSVWMPATIGHKFWRSEVDIAKACARPCVAIGKRLLMAVVRLPRLVSHIPIAGPSLPGETSGAAVVGSSLASVTVAVVAVAVSETNKSTRVIFHKGSAPCCLYLNCDCSPVRGAGRLGWYVVHVVGEPDTKDENVKTFVFFDVFFPIAWFGARQEGQDFLLQVFHTPV